MFFKWSGAGHALVLFNGSDGVSEIVIGICDVPTSYFDQFFTIDPGNPPPAGTPLVKSFLEIVDQNNNNLINRFSRDSVDGEDITASWPGDTITVIMNGATVTITGATFYLADGRAVFTPTDGTNLDNATFVSSTFVSTQASVPVGNLGPPCFADGTMIMTDCGEVAVDDLKVGDLVETMDHGMQAIRWIGKSDTVADGEFAPVVFRPGALGNERELRVSPQHRVLLQGWQAELYFGQAEILVPAKHLINDVSIVREPVEKVTYYHILFDRHEVVFSDGIATESFFPGDQIMLQNPHVRAELLTLFPELEDQGASALDQTARTTVKKREASVLLAAA